MIVTAPPSTLGPGEGVTAVEAGGRSSEGRKPSRLDSLNSVPNCQINRGGVINFLYELVVFFFSICDVYGWELPIQRESF